MSDPGQELTAVALVCTLSPSPAGSSSELIARQVLDELGRTACRARGAGRRPRCAARRAGSTWGTGTSGRRSASRSATADILLISTPTWMGQPSSVCQRVLERLDAELSETDDQGRVQTNGKVGDRRGRGQRGRRAPHQRRAVPGPQRRRVHDPGAGMTYWNGEAMHGTDYQDLDETPRPRRRRRRRWPGTRRTWPGCSKARTTRRPTDPSVSGSRGRPRAPPCRCAGPGSGDGAACRRGSTR